MRSFFSIPLFVIPVMSVFVAGCQQSGSNNAQSRAQATDTQAVLAGQIREAEQDRVRIFTPAKVSKRRRIAKLDTNGRFRARLPLSEPTYLIIQLGQAYTQAYVKPSDSLHMELNGSNFSESLVYSGDRAKVNNYLASKTRLSDSVGLSGKRTMRDLFRKQPASFIATLDSVESFYRDHFRQYFADDKPQPFARLEQVNISSSHDRQRVRYPRLHKRLAQDGSTSIPDSLSRVKNELPFNDPLLAKVPDYLRLVRGVMRDEKSALLQEQPSLEDTADGYVTRLVLDSLVNNEKLKAQLASQFLSRRIKRSAIPDIKPLYQYYEGVAYRDQPISHIDSLMTERREITPGREAPGFTYPSHSGDTVSLADLKGQYVYIDAWATWCGPCLREIPKLKELHDEMKDQNIAFVSISMDNTEDRGKWRSMVEDRELKGYQLFANGKAFRSKLAKDYLINSIPRFIIIGPDGEIIDPNAERPSQGVGERLKQLVSDEKVSA
jgi:thiol-disulfide isomerase/thioredoxin